GARDEALPGQQRLERGEPDLVVDERVRPPLRGRDLRDQGLPELLPLVQALLVQRDRHAERPPLPGLVEPHLAVPSGNPPAPLLPTPDPADPPAPPPPPDSRCPGAP